jgi:hypothetical protein
MGRSQHIDYPDIPDMFVTIIYARSFLPTTLNQSRSAFPSNSGSRGTTDVE